MDAERIANSGGLSLLDVADRLLIETVPTVAKMDTILENQAIIIAALTGKSKQDVEEETEERYHRNYQKATTAYYNWMANRIK